MSTITQLPNGSTVEKLADGTKISTSANGTVLKVLPDGTKIQTTKDGVELIVRPDGTKEQKNARGVLVVTYPDGRTVQTNPDGVRIEISADKKSRLQKNPDGSEILVRPDGSKLQKLGDGTEIEISADGKKTKKTISKDQTAGEAPSAPPALPASRSLPREVPPAIVSSNVKSKEAEIAAVTSIAQAKREAERADRAERELEVQKKRVAELQAIVAKSEDGAAVTKAAQEHAKKMVRLEAERNKAIEDKKEMELKMAKMQELVDGAEAQRAALVASNTEAVNALQAKLDEQMRAVQAAKDELTTAQNELAAARQAAETSESKALEMESTLTTLSSEKESLLVENHSLQEETRVLNAKVQDIILKGSSVTEMLAELKFERATLEERAAHYQEELTKAKVEIAELKAKLSGGVITTAAAVAEATTTTTESPATTEATPSATTSETEALKTDVQILIDAKEQAEMELLASKGDLERLQMELDSANITINQLKEEMATKDNLSETAQWKHRAHEAERLTITASSKMEDYEKELLKLKVEKEQLKLDLALGHHSVPSTSASSSSAQSPAESAEQVSAAATTHAIDEEKLQHAKDEIAQLQNQLASAQAQARRVELELKTEKESLEIKLRSAEDERSNLLEMVKGSGQLAGGGSGKSSSGKSLLGFGKKDSKKLPPAVTASGDSIDSLKAELADVNHLLAEKNKECELLEVKLKSLVEERSLELEELRSKLTLAEEHLKQKTQELEHHRPKPGSAMVSSESYSELQKEISALKVRFDLANTAKQAMEDQMKEAEIKAAEAEAKLVGNVAVEKIKELEQVIAQKDAEIESLKQNIMASERDKDAALADVARLAASHTSSANDAQEIQRLQARLAEVERDRDRLASELAAAKSASATVIPPVQVSQPSVPAVDTSSGGGTDFLSQLRAKQQTVTGTTASTQSMVSPKGTTLQAGVSPKGTNPPPNYAIPMISSSKPPGVSSYVPKPSGTMPTSSYLPPKTTTAPAPAAAATTTASSAAVPGKSNKIADMMKKFEKN